MSQLQFKSIVIKNFKTFTGEHKFDFDRAPGLYYIAGKNLVNPELGANGVGKSTIGGDALTWVLWGKTGRDNKPAAAITPWGTKGKTEVQLHYKRNGVDHFIYRTRNPNSLRHSEDASDDDVEITQEDIPHLIGMSEAMFRRTLVLGQFGELFLDVKPEAQAQMFNEALDLEVWTRARANASDGAAKANRDQSTFESKLSAQEILLKNIGIDIVEAETQSSLFEQDKAARIDKIKKGIVTLEEDLEELGSPPEQPGLPDTTKSAKLRADLAPIKVQLEYKLSDINRERGKLALLEQRLETMLAPKAKKVCETCGQAISDKEFAKNKERIEDEIKLLAVECQRINNETFALRQKGTDLKAKLDKALEDEEGAEEDYTIDLAAFNKYNEKLTAIRAELQRQRSALKQEEASTNSAEESLARLRTRRQGYRMEQGDLKEKQVQAAREAEQAEFWVDAFRELRLSIIDQALIELEMASSRHMSMLGLDDWGIRFATERETQSGKVSYAFSVSLYPPGQDVPVKWESYSGGESQRVQLAVAFGLSEVLLARAGLSPNFAVFDEPSKGLSPEGIDDLLLHLRERALNLHQAFYIVDHHSYDRGLFDGTLLVEKSNKGSNFRWL